MGHFYIIQTIIYQHSETRKKGEHWAKGPYKRFPVSSGNGFLVQCNNDIVFDRKNVVSNPGSY
jgi:hypothetical protein